MTSARFSIAALLLFLFAGPLSLVAETREADTLFFEANVLAAEENYAEAIPLFESALEKKPSPNIHYNLGNTYYALGDWGRARIHWERTLAMAPRHASARANLQLLLQEQNLASFESGVGAGFSDLLPLNQWTWAAVVGFWMIVAGLALARWKKARGAFALAGLGGTILLPSLAALFFMSSGFNAAILLEDQAALRVAPAPASPVAATLRAAQPLVILGSYGEFLRVRLADGQEGFVAAPQVERIRSL